MIGEGAAEKGTDDGGDAVRGADDTGQGGTAGGLGAEADDSVGSGADAGSSNTGDGTADDEGQRWSGQRRR